MRRRNLYGISKSKVILDLFIVHTDFSVILPKIRRAGLLIEMVCSGLGSERALPVKELPDPFHSPLIPLVLDSITAPSGAGAAVMN